MDKKRNDQVLKRWILPSIIGCLLILVLKEICKFETGVVLVVIASIFALGCLIWVLKKIEPRLKELVYRQATASIVKSARWNGVDPTKAEQPIHAANHFFLLDKQLPFDRPVVLFKEDVLLCRDGEIFVLDCNEDDKQRVLEAVQHKLRVTKFRFSVLAHLINWALRMGY